jgi:hypothetical protein
MKGGITERLGSRRRVKTSWLLVPYVVSCLMLNYKVSFCMFNHSWRKKTYSNVYSLCTLQSDKARPCLESWGASLSKRRKIYFQDAPKGGEGGSGNKWLMTMILYLDHRMVVFYVRALVVVLYIGNEVSFCKKMHNLDDIEYTHISCHIFNESHCFYILCWWMYEFYVYECMIFF